MASNFGLTTVLRNATVARNTLGRDLVVGDLHGHRTLLECELERIAFDPACDRVFSVGDLIDRGPESLATLALLDQPWFHAVLGNHELRLLHYLGFYGSRVHSRRAFAGGSGAWILPALSRHRRLVERLAERLSALPLCLHVDAEAPFDVMHTDRALGFEDGMGPGRRQLLCVHRAEAVTVSRANISGALQSPLTRLTFDGRDVQLSARPVDVQPITYVGHTPVHHITVHRSSVHIDQGVSQRRLRQGGDTPPTLIDHRRFSHWLAGVALARRTPATAATGRQRTEAASALAA